MGMSTPYPVTVSGNVGPIPIAGGFTRITGISVGETAGAAATIELHEGTAGGKIIGRLNLPANGSTSFGELPHVRCNGQLYVLVTGAIAGAIYFQ